MKANPVLKVENLTKRFPGTIANDSISLEVHAGEILSIVGENGAGKSTFCKMLTGVYHPDGGTISINGERVRIDSPIQSTQMGIAMVYQERNLVRGLSVADNVCLGHEPVRHGLLDRAEMNRQASEVAKRLGLSMPMDAIVSTLGAGEQQLVEIMRAFYDTPSLLILDEPTASLSESEVEPFLNFVQQIKTSMNLAVIFISHKMDEVFRISDRIAVFTDGRCVLCEPASALTTEQCISAMLRDHKIQALSVQEHTPNGEKLLDVRKCQFDGKKQNISFHVERGEIVGFYGLVGAGRTECMEALFGFRPCEELDAELDGEPIPRKHTPLQMLEKGVVLTPERRANGIFKTYSLIKNIDMLFLRKRLCNKLGLVMGKKSAQFAKQVLDENNVKYKDPEQAITTLSGGNIQKVIIGRSLQIDNVKLMILDEPTVGMDIGAKYEVYQKILDMAYQRDMGVIFISSELDELVSVCNRLYVFSDGDVFTEMDRKSFDKQKILSAAMREDHEKAVS